MKTDTQLALEDIEEILSRVYDAGAMGNIASPDVVIDRAMRETLLLFFRIKIGI